MGGPFHLWDLKLDRLCGSPVVCSTFNVSTACSHPQPESPQTLRHRPQCPLQQRRSQEPEFTLDESSGCVWNPGSHRLCCCQDSGAWGRGRKARAQPGSASVHHQDHHPAGLAQNSSPDSRKYFILLCFPTKKINKHFQLSMGPDSKEGEREREHARPPTGKSGFCPFSSFLQCQDSAL